MSTQTNYTEIANAIKAKFVGMVLGKQNMDVEEQLKLFTHPEMRKGRPGQRSVHKDGVKRCPHLNHFTGANGMVVNLDLLQMVATEPTIKLFTNAYKCKPEELGMSYGPPTVLIKPDGSGASTAFVYRFGESNENLRYTGLMLLSNHGGQANPGGVQKIANFEAYYDVLSVIYDFPRHCTDGSILYLEKWFAMDNANKLLEEYTAYHNYKVHGIPISLAREVSDEIEKLFEMYKIQVPQVFKPMEWVDFELVQGQLALFSSKEALRTLACKDKSCARVYVQIPVQVVDENWAKSELQQELERSYKSGKFGDWLRPGKRSYIGENKCEYNALNQSDIAQVWSFVQLHKSIFAI